VHMLYTVGVAREHREGWFDVPAASQAKLRLQILAKMRTLMGHPPRFANDAKAWFEGVQSDLAKVKAATLRSEALGKLGILRQNDFKDFKRMFKTSLGWKKAPDTKNALVKTEYKRNLLDAKLNYIQETTLPLQKKRKVSGDTEEVERLQFYC
jgi:hypothetical protein